MKLRQKRKKDKLTPYSIMEHNFKKLMDSLGICSYCLGAKLIVYGKFYKYPVMNYTVIIPCPLCNKVK